MHYWPPRVKSGGGHGPLAPPVADPMELLNSHKLQYDGTMGKRERTSGWGIRQRLEIGLPAGEVHVAEGKSAPLHERDVLLARHAETHQLHSYETDLHST